jgi:6-phosphofructokinase 1
VYTAAKERGWLRKGSENGNVTGILRGWKGVVGLASGGPGPDCMLDLTDEVVRAVDREGGTFLHTSRTRPDRLSLKHLPKTLSERRGGIRRIEGQEELFDVTDQVMKGLEAAGIDCLVAIGGDDTLGYGHTLNERGFPVIGIPKTMDNDVRGTEYAIGFKTALTRAEAFINRQRAHLASSELVGIFRIFGRNAGFTSLGTAMAISDIRCVIPEHRFDLESLCRTMAKDHSGNSRHYALVVASEGAMWEGGKLEEYGPADAYGHRKKMNVGDMLADQITRITGLATRMQDVTYDLRSGDADALDKSVASTFGWLAVDLLAQGITGRMVCVQDGRYAHTVLPDPAKGARTVDVKAHYDTERFRPNFSGFLGKPIFF